MILHIKLFAAPSSPPPQCPCVYRAWQYCGFLPHKSAEAGVCVTQGLSYTNRTPSRRIPVACLVLMGPELEGPTSGSLAGGNYPYLKKSVQHRVGVGGKEGVCITLPRQVTGHIFNTSLTRSRDGSTLEMLLSFGPPKTLFEKREVFLLPPGEGPGLRSRLTTKVS